MNKCRANSGFTLIEVLVALTILAVMSFAAYRGLSILLDARDRVEQENRKWREIALFFSRIESDLDNIVQRPIRLASGLSAAAMAGVPTVQNPDDSPLAFTRSGYAGHDGRLSTPQRIGYRLRNGALERVTWPVLDHAPYTLPEGSPLLAGVSVFETRYLDPQAQWQNRWPLSEKDQTLPAAIQIKLTLDSGEMLERVFALR
jgi:general secretion pathway protein J